MDVLLSVKPKYIEQIINGKKRYEFRKSLFRNANVKRIFLYSTSPVQRIIGLITFDKIIKDSPSNLWNNCKEFAGLSSQDFFDYFGERESGFAIKIDSVKVFDEPIDPRDYWPNFMPPQSFYYLDAIQFDDDKAICRQR